MKFLFNFQLICVKHLIIMNLMIIVANKKLALKDSNSNC